MRQMRGLALGGTIAVVLVAAWTGSAGAFEGVVKWRTLKVDKAPLAKVAGDTSDADAVFDVPLEALMKMHGEAKVSEFTLYVKGTKLRTENSRNGSYILMDL